MISNKEVLDALAKLNKTDPYDCKCIFDYIENLEKELKSANEMHSLAEAEIDAMERRFNHLMNNYKELYFTDFYKN